VILAGVLLKMGTYGFLRFTLPLFPAGAVSAAPLVVALAVTGIVYGAIVAMMQTDMKKLVAYSSVSHLGFVMLGLFALDAEGAVGALYQMLSHGVSTGALFLAVGVIYEQRHTRAIADFGGLWRRIPVYAAVVLVVVLSSAGVPGLNGFVGEFLILLGAFARWPGATAVAVTGVIFAAVYLLWMYQRVAFGPLSNPANETLRDLGGREIAVFAPLIALIVIMGVYPRPFHERMEPSVARILARVRPVLGENGVAVRETQGADRRASAAPRARAGGEDRMVAVR
jgi:NADH-quinone oxidoreductase subunit M